MAGESIVGIEFNQPVFKECCLPNEIEKQFCEYFSAKRRAFKLKTTFENATVFERKVYGVILDIPYGHTRSYKWVASMVGSPAGARAVGQALKKNPIPIIYPCHRVIASNGSFGGYSGGIEIKQRLLNLELSF